MCLRETSPGTGGLHRAAFTLPRRQSAITRISASHPVVAPLLRLCINGVGLLLMHDLDAWVGLL